MQPFLLLALLLSALLSGCVQPPKTVHVPVTVRCPVPTIPPKPDLPIGHIRQGDSPDQVVKAYVSTIKLLNGYNQELLHILQGYKS